MQRAIFLSQTCYLLSILALSIANGVQIILLPWLVLDHFSLGAVWVGWVQAAVLIPNLFLLLVGGVTADRQRNVQYLPRLLLGNIAIHLLLAVLFFQHWLTISLLIGYSIFLGLSNAFVQPGREYLLKQLSAQSVQKLVAKSSLCVYSGQAVGVIAASSMAVFSPLWLFLLQAVLVVIAIAALRKLFADIAVDSVEQNLPYIDGFFEGLRHVWQLPALRCLILIVGFSGFFHIGVFIVALPILVQQVYGQDVGLYSALQLTFLIGTSLVSMVVIYRNGLDDPGRRIIFSLLYGGVILLGLGAEPTLTGLFILIFAWGAVVGVSANMGRAVIQVLSPDSARGCIIAIYQLALFGFAPLGALCAGYAIEHWGVLPLLLTCGICSLAMFSAVFPSRSLWNVTTIED